jgi:hypothetical protein
MDVRFTVADELWASILRWRPARLLLRPGWSKLKDRQLEAAFIRPVAGDETFAEVLRWTCYRPPRAVSVEHVEAGKRLLRLCTLLDRSQLELAQPLIALFGAVAQAGGDGGLRLINDGTHAGELGFALALTRGEVKARRLRPDIDDDAARLGEELVALELGTPPPARTRIGKNPFTGEPFLVTTRGDDDTGRDPLDDL